ncbi:MAG: DnaA N-terminal domain-containing protein, partial [Actinomycetota bacterium]
MTGDGAQDVWNSCASALREQVSEAVWLSCFQEVRPLDLEASTLRLTVPSGIVKDRIQARYESLLQNALADIGREDVEVDLVVLSTDPPIETLVEEIDQPLLGAGDDDTLFDDLGTLPPTGDLESAELPGPPGADSTTIKSDQTFESFVIGSSNHFAHAAALRVAETPARSYNPL